MPVTLKDISEQSGLSLQTVSRILNGRGDKHQEATRERVMQVARDLGYRANSSAKAMRSGRFGSVALLLSEDPARSLLPTECRDGILDALGEDEINLILSRYSDDRLSSQETLPLILRQTMTDGLLINYNDSFPQRMIDLIAQFAIPAVWINSKQPADCVYPDDFDGAKRATEHLLSLGHRRIAFACFYPNSHYSYHDRIAGYEYAMRQAGLTPQTIVDYRGRKNQSDPAPDLSWLHGADRATAIIAYSDGSARFLLYEAAIQGLSAPDDFSLVVFNAAPMYDTGPLVTIMHLPEREIGRTAARMLLQKIESPALPLEPQALPLKLVEGATCLPLRQR